MELEILYEDNHLLVAVKPPEIPVQADDTRDPDFLNLLKAYIKEKYRKPGDVFLGLVHRLDRNAGGVMVFARTSKAASRLSAQIREHEANKTYLAVVDGIPEKPRGRLIHYLLKNKKTNTVSIVPPDTPEAREAVLDYELLSAKDNYGLVRVNLLTGRAHQIRVQLADIGAPLYGDVKYRNLGEKNENNLALWCWQMEIEHPVKKERMRFISNPPCCYPWNLFKIGNIIEQS